MDGGTDTDLCRMMMCEVERVRGMTSDHTGTALETLLCILETSFIKKFYSECDYPRARASITLIWDLGHDLYQHPDSGGNF